MKAFTLVLFLISATARAQTNDDMTDTRKKNESVVKIAQKDIRSELASFTMAGIDESVGKGDIYKIPFSEVTPNSMIFEGDGMKATVSTAPFVIGKHKLDYDEKYLIKIDRKTYYGGYGTVPKNFINKVTMVMGKDSIAIPASAYSDLYNLNFSYLNTGVQKSTNGIYRSKDGHRTYLYVFCKDKTGSYEVTWIFIDKIYLRRVVDYGFM